MTKLGDMTNAVVAALDDGANFHDACEKAIHEHCGIFHSKNREGYNIQFRMIMGRVKKRLGREAFLEVCKRPRCVRS